MMQKTLICLAAAALMASCSSNKTNDGFELKGNFSNSKGETIFLEKLSGMKPVNVDSTTIDENGNFEFVNFSPKIGFYRIKVDQQNFAMLVLDSSDKARVTGDIKDLGNTYKVEGSLETKLFIEYNAIAKGREIRLDSLNKAFQALMEVNKMDSRRMDSLSRIFEGPYNAIMNQTNQVLSTKIKQNTSMYSSIMAVQALDPDKNADVYKLLDEGLSKKFPNDMNIKMFHSMVEKTMAISNGQLAPDIAMNDPKGNLVALSSFKGKVVLIDFWASWCGPCRKEMPNVVKAYAKYKSKGFEIFGVSLDQDQDRWVEAIAKDGITWPQVSDLKQWESDAAKLYNVQAIPYTVLLDKEGKIIAKNLRGEELEKKLAEILN